MLIITAITVIAGITVILILSILDLDKRIKKLEDRE